MCILIVKPKGKPMPTKEIMDACRKANPDGCGFASPTHYYKGLDYDKFIEELYKVPDSEPCIIHLRWATHGSVIPRNCHPFVAKYEDDKVIMAHNGILPFSPYGDYTDSEMAFRLKIMPAILTYGYGSKQVANTISRFIGGSKIALLHKDKVCLFGHFDNINGVYYSNLRFTAYLNNRFAFYGIAV